MMEAIGGYFELELSNHKGFLHDDGVLLNTGRNALEYVLRALPNVLHLWIPYYTCPAVIEPVERLAIPHTFYHINAFFEIKESLHLRPGDYLIYTNYFGLKDNYVCKLAEQYGHQLIVDNAQAWFAEPISGVSTIYSPRKFVGVPDGGIAFSPFGIDIDQFEQDYSYGRCSHLLKRIDVGAEGGYDAFKSNESSFSNQPLRRMSELTRRVLESIDFDFVRERRWMNFSFLDGNLKESNLLCVEGEAFRCPMVYPFLTKNSRLRSQLIENKIFVATYWPNISECENLIEEEIDLTKNLLPIPCDQRFELQDMSFVVKTISTALQC